MSWRPALPERLAPRILLGATLAFLVVGAGAGSVLYTLHRDSLVSGLAESTTTQGALLEQGLRHAMIDRDPRLLSELVARLGREPGIERVLVLDRRGQVRFSSDPGLVGAQMSRTDPACMLCHRKTADERGRSAILTRSDGTRALTNVTPIRNEPQCYGCHSPASRLNGVLLVDHSLAAIDRRLSAEAIVFAGGTLATLLVLGAVLALLLHRLVLRPLRKMRTALVAAEQGRLDASLNTNGSDEMSRLADQYNRMAASLRGMMNRLRDREEYLAGILGSARDGIVIVDRHMNVVDANPAYLELCGMSLDQVVGRSCSFAGQCRIEEQENCPSWNALHGTGNPRIIRKLIDGRQEKRIFEICASPLAIDGERTLALEVWRDITERTRLEAELAHSERLTSLGRLASGISHEINNPLGTIATCLDGLQRRLCEGNGSEDAPALVKRYLGIVQKEVYRCRDLTGKLALLSQKSSPVRKPLSLNGVVTEILSLLEFEMGDKGVRVVTDLAPRLPEIEGDEAGLHQVILNILLNALQASGNDGRIQVGSREVNGRVQVRIADDGCGIEPADLDHVFEPFYSARRTGRGTGLGLSISNEIVRSHGGSIEIESSPGRGTQVTITLPVDVRSEVAIQERPAAAIEERPETSVEELLT